MQCERQRFGDYYGNYTQKAYGVLPPMVMSTPTASCAGSGAASALTAALQFLATTQCLLTEPWPPNYQITPEDSYFDVIVVGGGTAGSTLAARLSEVSLNVLLIEAGSDPPQESIIPGMRNLLKASRYDWNFTSENDHYSSQSLKDGRQRQPRGKMLGGSGSINDMVYSRGFPYDYYEWAEIAGQRWNWTNVLDYFKKTEKLSDQKIVEDPELAKYHGFDGEIEVSGFDDIGYTNERFLDAFEELGFNIVNDMTYPDKIGAGRFSHTVRKGRRDSSAVSLLNTAGNRVNLSVLKDTFVTRILIENGTAKGIEALSSKGEKLKIFARKEVVISTGTFNTPKLLMLSGIGPRKHLQEIGIEVVQDLPVGENLQDHVMVMTYIAAAEGTCNFTVAENHMEVIKYFYDQTGSYSLSNSVGAYIPSLEYSNVPEFAIYPTCLPMKSGFHDGCSSVLGFKDSICKKLDSINQNWELISQAVVLLKPKSRGRVQLKSSDPLAEPLIYSGTFSELRDLIGFPQAMRIANAVADTSYFRSKDAFPVRLEVEDCAKLKTEELWWRCWSRSMATSAWHAVGTAAVGSVVDGELNVRGIRGLRVVDASVMPTVTRGNTNAPVIMIAELAADLIKGDIGIL